MNKHSQNEKLFWNYITLSDFFVFVAAIIQIKGFSLKEMEGVDGEKEEVFVLDKYLRMEHG